MFNCERLSTRYRFETKKKKRLVAIWKKPNCNQYFYILQLCTRSGCVMLYKEYGYVYNSI